jgi:hypothetical protein
VVMGPMEERASVSVCHDDRSNLGLEWSYSDLMMNGDDEHESSSLLTEAQAPFDESGPSIQTTPVKSHDLLPIDSTAAECWPPAALDLNFGGQDPARRELGQAATYGWL